MRRKFQGNGETWGPVGKPERILEKQAVHLDDHAVDLEGQLLAFLAEFPEIRVDTILADHLAQIGHGQAQGAQAGHGGAVGGPVGPTAFAPILTAQGIGKKGQRPGRGDLRVELTHGAGGGISRVGEDLGAMFPLAFVEFVEILAGHDHFAAHFKQTRDGKTPPDGLRA